MVGAMLVASEHAGLDTGAPFLAWFGELIADLANVRGAAKLRADVAQRVADSDPLTIGVLEQLGMVLKAAAES